MNVFVKYLREDRTNMRNDLILAVSEGKISENTAKELIEKYDSKFLDICEKLSNKDIEKYYELEEKRLAIYLRPKSFGESITEFTDSFTRGTESLSKMNTEDSK